MTPPRTIHFQRSRPVPLPWVRSGEIRRSKTSVESSFTLSRVRCAADHASKRVVIRTALDEELQLAAGRRVRWRETAKGPEVLESLGWGHVSVSISYAPAEAWLALGWEGPIGVDAVAIEVVSDWRRVAAEYLEPSAQERLDQSTRPALDFAREWAGFEARLKLAGMSLGEGLTPPPALLFEATFGGVFVAVAVN